MIDIENIVFTTLLNELTEQYTDIEVNNTYIDAPVQMPCVNIVEEDNILERQYMSDTKKEMVARVMYSINIFSNSASGKKAEAKEIAQTIDSLMTSMGFVRTVKNEIPNVDRTIFRMVLRYEGRVTDEVNGVYRVYK